jgi:hypothetical protein
MTVPAIISAGNDFGNELQKKQRGKGGVRSIYIFES